MKIVLQRVSEAAVSVGGSEVSRIGRGLMVLVGIEVGDTPDDCRRLAAKTAALRIFPDERGVMNLSVADIGGEVLAISQFTLAASTARGNRPSYVRAAGHELAIPLYDMYADLLEEHLGRPTRKGVFGADMAVSLVNDGPVTIVMETQPK